MFSYDLSLAGLRFKSIYCASEDTTKILSSSRSLARAKYTILKLNIQNFGAEFSVIIEWSIFQIFAKHGNNSDTICSVLSR